MFWELELFLRTHKVLLFHSCFCTYLLTCIAIVWWSRYLYIAWYLIRYLHQNVIVFVSKQSDLSQEKTTLLIFYIFHLMCSGIYSFCSSNLSCKFVIIVLIKHRIRQIRKLHILIILVYIYITKYSWYIPRNLLILHMSLKRTFYLNEK